MSQVDLLSALSEAHRKHLDSSSPAPLRMMAARGMAPLPPREMVIVLAGLTLDGDEKLASAAKASLLKLPDKIFAAALEHNLPAPALMALAEPLVGREELAEKLVLKREAPDELIATMAEGASERVAEIIASNQERCLRSPEIVRALTRNSSILRSSLDRLFDFLVRSGVVWGELPQFGEALARLSPAEIEDAVSGVQLPSDLRNLIEENEDDAARAESAAAALDASAPDSHERVPVLKLVHNLSVAQKVALAIKGNKEARAILVRDTNRVVASSAIRNPRVTEQEVVSAAQSRSVCDEVIRIIAASKEMARGYAVKLALVNNPKTPLPVAMRMLTLLRANDVKNIAKSRNVSSAVANQAKRLISAKR